MRVYRGAFVVAELPLVDGWRGDEDDLCAVESDARVGDDGAEGSSVVVQRDVLRVPWEDRVVGAEEDRHQGDLCLCVALGGAREKVWKQVKAHLAGVAGKSPVEDIEASDVPF